MISISVWHQQRDQALSSSQMEQNVKVPARNEQGHESSASQELTNKLSYTTFYYQQSKIKHETVE